MKLDYLRECVILIISDTRTLFREFHFFSIVKRELKMV